MSISLDMIVVGAVVVLALGYVGWRMKKAVTGGGCHCGNSCTRKQEGGGGTGCCQGNNHPRDINALKASSQDSPCGCEKKS